MVAIRRFISRKGPEQPGWWLKDCLYLGKDQNSLDGGFKMVYTVSIGQDQHSLDGGYNMVYF